MTMTSQLVYQRLRNRIIETLEWILESKEAVPELGFNELINSWEDYVRSPLEKNAFPSPAYTDTEDSLLRVVDRAMDAFCDATPPSVDDGFATLALPEWAAVISAASAAHAELMKRGKLSEETEIPSCT